MSVELCRVLIAEHQQLLTVLSFVLELVPRDNKLRADRGTQEALTHSVWYGLPAALSLAGCLVLPATTEAPELHINNASLNVRA